MLRKRLDDVLRLDLLWRWICYWREADSLVSLLCHVLAFSNIVVYTRELS